MFCTNCGNQVKEGAFFCPKCGKALKPKENTEAQPMPVPGQSQPQTAPAQTGPESPGTEQSQTVQPQTVAGSTDQPAGGSTEQPDAGSTDQTAGTVQPVSEQEQQQQSTIQETQGTNTERQNTAQYVDATQQPYVQNMQQPGGPQTTDSQGYNAGAGGVYQAAGAAGSAGNSTPKKSRNGLIIGIVAALGAVVVLVAALLVFGLSKNNYKAPLGQLSALMNKRETNLDKYASALLPKFADNAYKNGISILEDYDEAEEAIEDLQDELKYLFENADDTFGKNWKFSYKITDAERLDESELKDIKREYKDLRDYLDYLDEYLEDDGYYYEDMADEIGSGNMKKLQKLVDELDQDLKELKITDGYDLEIELTIKGSEDKEKTDISIRVLKINGKWTFDLFSSDALTDIYY